MKLKLTKLKPEYKDKFVIELDFMHGDADAYTKETYVCENEADFKRVVLALEDVPQDPGSGGDEDEYQKWQEDTFNDECFIPCDVTGCDYPAAYNGSEFFYYDKEGIKHSVEILD